MTESIVGILLAAGGSTRFGANKLLHPMAQQYPLAVLAARNLISAIPNTIAVIRPEDQELKRQLAAMPVPVIDNPNHQTGMSSSIVCGVRASQDAAGWVIALADMPYIPCTVIEALVQRLQAGAAMVAPVYRDERGHPVGFDKQFCDELLQLQGDSGARAILLRHPDLLQTFAVEDSGVLWDIDHEAVLVNPVN